MEILVIIQLHMKGDIMSENPQRATCPNCSSNDYFCIRSKDRNYSFVLGISNPEDNEGRIIPYLPVRVLACDKCKRISMEVETYE